MSWAALILIFSILATAGSSSAVGQPTFTFHSQFSYVDETKIFRVLGEVRNESNENIREILVSASFRDAKGDFLGEFKRSAEYHSLAPGESSPFEILYLNQETSDAVTDYTLSATGVPSEIDKDLQLEIVSSNSRLDLLGTLYLNALARNNGNQTATNTLLVATLYDKEERVLAIGRALAEAVRGSGDIPAGSEGAFGVAVVDKLQTYKAVKYSLVSQSDQYSSEKAYYRISAPGQGSPAGNQTQNGCLIATAAFGSEFAPQVQQLREFRDGIAMQTIVGSSFMNAFNLWYYSFSPAVADYERQSPYAREIVQIVIQPLLAILGAGTLLHEVLLSIGIGNELAVVATGMMSSALIGLLYLSPVAVIIGVKKRRILSGRMRFVLMSFWAFSIPLVAAGVWSSSIGVLTVGTVILVVCSIMTAVLLLSDRISRL